jgi:hypothetical protein
MYKHKEVYNSTTIAPTSIPKPERGETESVKFYRVQITLIILKKCVSVKLSTNDNKSRVKKKLL